MANTMQIKEYKEEAGYSIVVFADDNSKQIALFRDVKLKDLVESGSQLLRLEPSNEKLMGKYPPTQYGWGLANTSFDALVSGANARVSEKEKSEDTDQADEVIHPSM